MKNTVCRSDTCPNCGRRIEYSCEIAGINIEPECGAPRKHTGNKP